MTAERSHQEVLALIFADEDRDKDLPLEERARRLAEKHLVLREPGRPQWITSRLKAQENLLSEAHKYFSGAPAAEPALSYAAEWLLDNYYIVQQALREVREDMPKGYYQRLPKLQNSGREPIPRIYAVALGIFHACRSHLQIDTIQLFTQGYQQARPLLIGEVWALPTMLRLIVIEYLTRAVVKITRLPFDDEHAPPAVFPLPGNISDENIVANAILSLRMLADEDWKDFFERVSLVEQALRNDPLRVYEHMDFETRDAYRKEIEEAALAADCSEVDAARQAVHLAERGNGEDVSPRFMHVGYYIKDKGRPILEQRLGFRPAAGVRVRRWLLAHPAPVYLTSIGILVAALLIALIWYSGANRVPAIQVGVVCLLFFIPALRISTGIVNWIITHVLPPRILAKLDFRNGVPSDFRTMVVVPTLLTHPGEVKSLLERLERHFLGNVDPNISFALLGDFADAPMKQMPGDDALVAQAVRGVQELNARHSRPGMQPFYFFNREREWNPSEGVWMGWERKRGNLQQFNHLLLGRHSSYRIQIGDLSTLPHMRYVITLDADTLLPRDSARRLIATLAHPLNQAQIEPPGKITAGYCILQPRTDVMPTSANQSLFTRTFAGDTGIDLYTRAVSDVYQDFFGEGIYVGKGIYDVAAFEACLERRLPENAILSHDLIEGLHGRVALVSDIIFLEDYPANYLLYMQRHHRWVRGDWQLLPWLLSRGSRREEEASLATLSLISRWKIFDNLCRSLVAPALFALLVLSWLWLEGSPLAWTLIFVLSAAVPLAAALTIDWKNNSSARLLATKAARWLLVLVFLPHEAVVMLHAIGSTIIRLVVSRRHLLQWTSAAHAFYLFKKEKKLLMFWQQMLVAPALAMAVGLPLVLMRPESFPVAAPFLLLWFISPQVAYHLSRPHAKKRKLLSDEQRRLLRCIARRTWFFFEHFVGPEDHWLPPDHFQENPRGLVAHRTSVTNIGLMLASIVAASDFGYISSLEMISRLRNAFESMDILERYRGHFLNWYDTQKLEPLLPRYVSTVDSGNLAACLIALQAGLKELRGKPAVSEARWMGLSDTIGVFDAVVRDLRHVSPGAISSLRAYVGWLRDTVERIAREPDAWMQALADLDERDRLVLERRLMELIEENVGRLDASSVTHLRIWFERIRHHIRSIKHEMEALAPWLPLLEDTPPFIKNAAGPLADDFRQMKAMLRNPPVGRIPALCHQWLSSVGQLREEVERLDVSESERRAANQWLNSLEKALAAAEKNSGRLVDDLNELAQRAEKYVSDMQFGFLFDAQREIFHIGYNVDSEQLDSNRYDLLASEARIASIVAIAKGDVPQSHWLHLSRPLALVDSSRVLLSWAGTMFEYLMPALLVRQYDRSLLDQSSEAAITRQIEYCKKKRVPWGMSESGYYRFDVNLNYQYRAFGVPGLGFKRGLGEDLVISPYSSLLALPIRPTEAIRNIEQLVNLHMLGQFGFYEAADYTPSRLVLGQERSIVQSYMSHHQSMILLASANYFYDDIMVRRFHSDPLIQSVETLLQEQLSYRAPLEEIPLEEVAAAHFVQPLITAIPWKVPVQSPFPQAYYLSNGSFGTLITSAGSGYSSWKDIDVTRWRADTTLDDWGTWIYVQDLDAEELGSVAYQPAGAAAQEREVFFYPHKADFRSKMADIILHMEVTVPPEEDGEIRRLTLTNQSPWPRRVAVTSYAEVVLAPREADRRHPAFSKMFIQSEFRPELNALVFRRRTRSPEDSPVHLAHTLVLEPGVGASGMHETDRHRFVGRGGSIRRPAAMGREGPAVSNTTGATLDPIMALSQEIIVEPHAASRVAFITMIAERRRQVLGLAGRYQDWSMIDRAFEMARARSEMELRQLQLSVPNLERYQQMLSLLMYPHPILRAEPAVLAANTKGQPSLWRFSISGDYPILLARIAREEETALVRELLKAHTYWRNRRLKVDFVILNLLETGYSQELHNQLLRLLSQTNNDTWLNQRGGIFLLRADQMSDSERVLIETVARLIFDGEKGSLDSQLEKLAKSPTYLPAFTPTPPEAAAGQQPPALARPESLQFDNGIGGFSPDGKEYIMYLEPGRRTPLPWSNVISNPEFGFLVTESGGGCTWALNSGENRLTSWTNDPVLDRPGEALYLRDEETAEIWSPTPLPAGAQEPYLVRHGAGYSVFEHQSHEVGQVVTLFAPLSAPVKIVQVRLENQSSRVRRFTMTYYCEWVLGNSRDVMQQYVIPEFQKSAHALLARNPYNTDFSERVAFLASGREPFGITTDRTEFLGRLGDFKSPAGLQRVGLSGTVVAGMDPCAAFQLHIDLYPNESVEEIFLVGQAADRRAALEVIEEYRELARVENALAEVKQFWDDILGAITVETPDRAMNLLLNRWLLYQNLSCRVWGRSALYQSSGAYGYRDQLQDVLALLHAAPEIARAHIVRAAGRQFDAGDVLHWWHPPSGKGVRTRTSDDLLWLPFVTAKYVEATGDSSILREEAPFLRAEPLKQEEAERYGEFPSTIDEFPLYEHCRRAIRKGSTSGAHGLPLIGTGDWNDGMNYIGAKGYGESIWMGWFLYSVLKAFIPICRAMGDEETASAFLGQAEHLQRALETSGWDERWYLRAYHDDGSLVGSAKSVECRIDSIAQSWALLSEAGEPGRARTAMESVWNHLVKTREKLVLLFTPPFDKTPHDPGYIKAYPPGIRENGGQYTHAALWVVWAFTLLGEGGRAEQLFRLLSPIYHTDAPEKVDRYQVEPYVVAADVYGVHPFIGRGGWTWYTGSAGWMYRLGVEAILGLHRKGNLLEIRPCIPRTWPGYRVSYRFGKARYDIRVENPRAVSTGVEAIVLDGRRIPGNEIPLKDDGRRHEVVVRIGKM